MPADALWKRFQTEQENPSKNAPGLSATASLNYKSPEKKTRVLLKLWGNLEYPLRLDLLTGFGSPIAYFREDDYGRLVYVPSAETAFFYRDPEDAALWPGEALPFSLQETALIAAGRFERLLPETFTRAKPAPDMGWQYLFSETGRVRSLTLDGKARPVRVQGVFQDRPWTLLAQDHGRDESGEIPGPEKLTLEFRDASAVLRIKKIEPKQKPWPEEALALKLPPGTKTRVQNGKNTRTLKLH
ncbi:MAG: hypothetical protein SVS15_07225 [Thermodesulfobacteriota bacterium]|nr:hypothetical protein [Thermodesulfobacteriota bacterium]